MDRYSVRVGMATPGRQVNSRCRLAALICIQSDDAASWLGPPRPAPAQCPVKVTDAAASVARSGPAVWDRMKLTRCHLRCCRYHLDCGCGDWTCAAVFDRPRLSVSVSLLCRCLAAGRRCDADADAESLAQTSFANRVYRQSADELAARLRSVDSRVVVCSVCVSS